MEYQLEYAIAEFKDQMRQVGTTASFTYLTNDKGEIVEITFKLIPHDLA